MKRWIISIVVFLGVGAGFGNLDNLEGNALPIAGQIITLVAVGLLALIKAAKDEDHDNVPDAVQATRFGKIVKWLVPILVGIAGAAGVTTLSGCGGSQVPVAWVDSSIKGEATITQGGSVDGYAETNHNFLIYGMPVSLNMYYADRSVGGCITIANMLPVCYKHVFEGDQDGQREREYEDRLAETQISSISRYVGDYSSNFCDFFHRRDQRRFGCYTRSDIRNAPE